MSHEMSPGSGTIEDPNLPIYSGPASGAPERDASSATISFNVWPQGREPSAEDFGPDGWTSQEAYEKFRLANPDLSPEE